MGNLNYRKIASENLGFIKKTPKFEFMEISNKCETLGHKIKKKSYYVKI